MSTAEELLKQGLPQNAQLNYNTDNYMKNYNSAMSGYQQTTTNALNNYKDLGTQNVNALKQQTQQQMAFLNQQLEANKQKYQLQGEQQTATINKQYNEANTQIDNQAFESYKMANQMGATRGVSNSAQQQAMDNSVGQQTAGLFNQNLTSKNDSLNTLRNTISSQMLDLDLQHSSNVNDLQLNQMQKQMEIMNQMSEKEFDYLSQQADKVLEMQMSNNELQFNTEKEKEQYRAQLVTQLYEMQISNAQKVDDRTFQSAESQKDREFQASQNALDRALQSALSKASSSKSSEDSDAKFTEDEIMFQEQLSYYVGKGMSYMDAMKYAKADVERYMNGNGKTDTATQKKYSTLDSAMNTALYKRASSIFNNVTPTSSSTKSSGSSDVWNKSYSGSDLLNALGKKLLTSTSSAKKYGAVKG